MYSQEERMRAVQLYIKYNMSVAAVIRELGYPSRQMLYLWYKEFNETGALRNDSAHGHSKYSDRQRKQAVDYYAEHGRSISRTIKALGYPKRTTLRDWIEGDLPGSEKHCVTGKTLVRCIENQKEQAVIQLCAGEASAKEIASELGVAESSLHRWKKCLLSGERDAEVPKKRVQSDETIEEIKAERDELLQQRGQLQKELYRLRLECDVLIKAEEILKKDRGINPKSLKNREKAVLIDALREKYRLKELLAAMDISKSSYCYQKNAQSKPDKHSGLRSKVREVFAEARNCYGYRRIHAAVRRLGTIVSEKIIRRIMREEQLAVYRTNKRSYSSYAGEISPEVPNLVNRDFSADTPNAKWLTDITEFSISAGKVYLSPIIDCFDGMVVSWTIGMSPDSGLVNSMLDAAVSVLDEGERPILHSDRGCHYRWPGWLERMQKAELTRSMSKKGCSPDNSACEGFFGRLKNEMFYGRSWIGVSLVVFINALDSYLRWYNEKRIKMSLGAMSPLEYRRSLSLA